MIKRHILYAISVLFLCGVFLGFAKPQSPAEEFCLRPPARTAAVTASPIDSFCAMSPRIRAELDTVARLRWGNDPTEALAAVRIDDIGRLQDNNDPSIRAYLFSTNRGTFLVLYEPDSWDIAGIAVEMVTPGNRDYFIDVSGEPYFGALKAQFARVDMETRFINGNVNGKIYAPLVRTPRDADAIRGMAARSMFLRHLLEDERVVSFGASSAGVYHFWRTQRKHQGLITVNDMPQICSAISSYSMGDSSMIAHEIVHMVFSLVLMQSHAQQTILWNYFNAHHRDFMQEVIGDYYLRELTDRYAAGQTVEATRLLASETLSVLFDSFMKPAFDGQRQAIIRKEAYALRARRRFADSASFDPRGLQPRTFWLRGRAGDRFRLL